MLDCGAEEFGAQEKAWRFKSAKGTWYEIEIVESMEALGVMLDRRMSTEAALNHRWRKAKGPFVKDIKYYTTPGMPYIRKFEKYVAEVQSCFLHASGGWSMTREHADRIPRVENWCLVKISVKRKLQISNGICGWTHT